jgi:hypothetical protein
MAKTNESVTQFEVHDAEILSQARAVLDTCHSLQDIQVAVLAAVARNEEWRENAV